MKKTAYDSRAFILLGAIYLALAPSVWFWFLTFGTIKKILLVFLGLFSLPTISRHPKGLVFFILISAFIFFSILNTHSQGDQLYLFFGIIENYLFFLLGYNVVLKGNTSKLILLILAFPFFECILTITNFLVDIPGWYAPSQVENMSEFAGKGYEMLPLWGTGFSWGRNGWGCSLALLLPLCFGIEKKKKNLALLLYVIIITSIVICGNRNGLLASIIALYLFYHFAFLNKRSTRIGLFLLFAVLLIVIIYFGQSFLVTTLRLDSGDISAGRFFQYALIPDMISKMSFWGLGEVGTGEYLFQLTGDLGELHNTYFRLLIDYGWLLGITVFFISIYALIVAIKTLKSGRRELFPFALIVISGLSLALFEPRAVFFTLGGYAIWWFSLGKILYYKTIDNGKS